MDGMKESYESQIKSLREERNYAKEAFEAEKAELELFALKNIEQLKKDL